MNQPQNNIVEAVRLNALHTRMRDVLNITLHAGQVQMAKAYFVDRKKIIMSQWGRNAGKTAADLYIANRAAIIYPNFEIYIILPEKEQAEDVYWEPKRLQTFAPPEYVTEISQSNLTVKFDTGSTIALHGAKNVDSLRGTKPHLVFYDESQGHSSEFHKEVMAPNLLGKNSALILTGTPPKVKDCFYYSFKEEVLEDIKNGDTSVAYFEFPTSINPIIDKNQLEKMRLRLVKSGDISIWMREYLGKDCFVGRDSVFPTFSLVDHVKPRVFIQGLIEGDIDKLKWITVADPATTGVFAVLFAAYNPATNQLFILDEIWENDRRLTDSHTMWKRIREKEKALYNGKWQRVYDESAVWFANEVSNNFKHESPNWRPTRKRKDKVEDGISKIKQLQNTENSYFVASECVKFIWETENYVTDEEGYLPKNNDDLMDVQRYLVDALDVRSAEKGSQRKDAVLKIEYQDTNRPAQTLTSVNSNWASKAMEAVETSDIDTYVSWEDW